MFMLEQRIQQQLFESADLHSHSADALSRPIAQAAQALLGSITAGGKAIFAGGGPSSALAAYGAALLVGRFERERPPLAALALAATDADTRALEVQALGAPGDVLVVLGASAPAALLPAVRAARDKDMVVVALLGATASPLAQALGETDVPIAVPHERTARILELHLAVLHALADAVDLQLMGEQEPPP